MTKHERPKWELLKGLKGSILIPSKFHPNINSLNQRDRRLMSTSHERALLEARGKLVYIHSDPDPGA